MDDVIARARAGDRAALEVVLGDLAPRVARFARRLCADRADRADGADDAAQDALVTIATHLDKFEGKGALSSWAFAIVRRACSRRARGKRNQPHEGEEALASTAADVPDPSAHVENEEARQRLLGALDALPRAYREIIHLRDLEGLSGEDTASALGLSLDAAKSRLHRARAALHEQLTTSDERGCQDVARRISEQLEGELSTRGCDELEAHARACPSCARACAKLREALAICARVPSPLLDDDDRARVTKALRACGAKQGTSASAGS